MLHPDSHPLFVRAALAATALALVVVVLGAFVRLSDAGLGCPDWPGCYGHIGVPQTGHEIARAGEAFPDRPVEPAKAWKEMIHRYFAGALGLLILGLAVLSWRRRFRPGQPRVLPWVLVGLVGFQALLGMWTVTLLLQPVIVMGHLLGGMTILALLWWLTLRSGHFFVDQVQVGAEPASRAARAGSIAVVAVVFAQLMLGGWTSANYAALACGDFPMCQGSWWPAMDFADGFSLPAGTGADFEGGLHGVEGRTAIHVAHRIGAVVTLLVVGWFALRMALSGMHAGVRRVALAMLVILLVQVSLGVANVLLSLPLPVAVAHNAGAAALLLSTVTMLHVLRPATPVV